MEAEMIIYLDTHVAIWLYEGLIEKLSTKANKLIDQSSLLISPAVILEIQYLHEIKRCTVEAEEIVRELQEKINLQICQHSFQTIIYKSLSLNWTRDPFDRIIVAHAIATHKTLLTKDQHIHKHYKMAAW